MTDDSENVNRAVRLLREAADVLAQTNINFDTWVVNQQSRRTRCRTVRTKVSICLSGGRARMSTV